MVEKTFHEAIRTGDPAARLIYADWLEEQGRSFESALLRTGRWCLVPAGSFWMGGGGGVAGELRVEIPHAFYLGAYTVTQGEWQEVMGSNPSYFSRNGGGKGKVKNFSDEKLANFPVESVSWDDAQEYIQQLNEKARGSGFVYGLPTAREWEYACRGAATSKKECSYNFYFAQPTNAISPKQANFDGNYEPKRGKYLERTTRVGSYHPNRLGLYDMHGNVWEWCQDLSDEGSGRVFRGGGWGGNGAHGCRAAYSSCSAPTLRSILKGFRVALFRSGKARVCNGLEA